MAKYRVTGFFPNGKKFTQTTTDSKYAEDYLNANAVKGRVNLLLSGKTFITYRKRANK